MQSTIIKIGLVILFIGITPSYAQSKQGTPTEKPWYFSETFITGFVLMVVTGLSGVALGATKQVSQAEKDKFKREFLKEEIIPLIDQKIAANEQIKGLQLEVILSRIENNIEKLSTEIHGMYSSQEVVGEVYDAFLDPAACGGGGGVSNPGGIGGGLVRLSVGTVA